MKTGVDETQLKRLLRHAMTNDYFREPSKNHVAHTSLSQILVTDRNALGWTRLVTDSWWAVTTRTIDAVQKWPGSTSPKETGVSLWAGKKTQWFEELAKMEGGLENFREGMSFISTGEGWEDKHFVDGFPWADLPENSTVVDVSLRLRIRDL